MEIKALNKKWIVWGVVYAILLLLTLTVANLTILNQWLGTLWLIVRPVALGLALAYLLNPIFSFLERKIFSRIPYSGFRRFMSLLFTYVIMLLLIVFLFWLILPQLFESISSLVKNYETYLDSLANYVNGLIAPINGFLKQWTQKDATIGYWNADGMIDSISKFLASAEFENALTNSGIPQITSLFSVLFAILKDWIFAIFISLYFLVSKEKRVEQVMRLRNAIFNDKVNGRISRAVATFDHSFGGFIKGKCLDSAIIWVLTYISFSIFKIPFALLLSSFIGILSIIPIMGLIIGAIPASIIILLAAPEKIIPFIIILILIQQLDSNILAPKILGDNTGVSSLCVIIAISTMGAIWGVAGMLLGVPLFASLLKIGDYYLEKRLRAKGLPAEIENYYPSDALVDPVKDSHLTSDKTVKRLEKNILRIRIEMQSKKLEDLNRRDRFYLRIYKYARKYKILTSITDETQVQFLAEKQAEGILLQEEAYFDAEINNINDSQDNTAKSQTN